MEKFFKLKENKTNVSTEVFAGLTTFMTMAYILAVNPDILSAAGMDKGAVFTATALASIVGTMAMALLANYPFVLAPGMGLNAYFAFTVAQEYGWQVALCAVFVEGIIFLLFSLVNVREAIFEAIPITLKHSVSAGIGLFIAFIGFTNAGIIVKDDVPGLFVKLGNISNVTVLLALFGLIFSATLMYKKIKGALFWGILCTYLLGVLAQAFGLYVPNPEAGLFSLYPTNVATGKLAIFALPPTLGDFTIIGAYKTGSLNGVTILGFVTVVFAFLFVDVFDTIGTLIGVSTKANMLDEDGKLTNLKPALLADAIGTTVGAFLGTSTVTTYVESAAGVAEGGRTGLTATVSAGLFALALFLSPLFLAIPSFATAPALIIVGVLMLGSIVKVNFDDMTEAVPAFLTVTMMAFAYSISKGLIFGVLSYVILKIVTGKAKQISVVMYIISVLFLIDLLLEAGVFA